MNPILKPKFEELKHSVLTLLELESALIEEARHMDDTIAISDLMKAIELSVQMYRERNLNVLLDNHITNKDWWALYEYALVQHENNLEEIKKIYLENL